MSPAVPGFVPLDVCVFPQDNSNTRKEGVSRTYHNYDGYAPIAAYLGLEGWCLEVELRPGSQHSQKGAVEFLQRVIVQGKTLTEEKILVRADSAHDALETLIALEKAEVCYIIKWNPRKNNVREWRDRVFAQGEVVTPRPGKSIGTLVVEESKEVNGAVYQLKRIVRVTERTIDKHGQLLVAPEVILEGWWTNLSLAPEMVIDLYRQHATSEQFHSEFKTDLDLERLPSGKFATNSLIMALGAFAYNILRYIGQQGLLGSQAPLRHPAKRRRIKTVIQELMYLAARLISKGRRLTLRFSRCCPAFVAFGTVYRKLIPAARVKQCWKNSKIRQRTILTPRKQGIINEQSSSPREPPPQALTEPDVNVSAHPVPIIQPLHVRGAVSSGQTDMAVFA